MGGALICELVYLQDGHNQLMNGHTLPLFEWYLYVRFVVQNETCYVEVGLCAQSIPSLISF